METTFPVIEQCIIRAGFPMAGGLMQATRRRVSDSKSVSSPGYIPPVAQYRVRGSDKTFSIALRETDLLLVESRKIPIKEYLGLVVAARRSLPEAAARLEALTAPLLEESHQYYAHLRLTDDRFVVPSVTKQHYSEELIGDKGAMLLRLYQDGYPVPDFSIVTSEIYTLDAAAQERCVVNAISDVESLTRCSFRSNDAPLLIAMRCVMPSYIPGVLPTYLNVGATRTTMPALERRYGYAAALKVYCNNLKNIYELLFPDQHGARQVSSQSSLTELERTVGELEEAIGSRAPQLLEDPHRQVFFFMNAARSFYEDNQDILLTFTRGKRQYPAVIMQKMVLGVRDDASYSGVLYSKHPRTGRGKLIECARNIFGEEIMTGTVQPESTEFFDSSEVQDAFPALYHFVPLLTQLERKFATPVTIEFSAETEGPINRFALLQLNASEMTGRATLVSTVDMYHGEIIPLKRVTELIKPYHLRQIISDAIHESSFSTLKFFAKGLSLLPRTAVTARAYFSASNALAAKKRGEKVCFCKQSFIPSDAIVMSEMDAMMSLTPAAIHVVTNCRGAGIPAFLNLESSGVRLEGQALVNKEGLAIREGDWVTLSSKRQAIYLGQATYTPARFQKYLEGEPLELNSREKLVFEIMAKAYRQYRALIRELKAEQIETINDLIRLVRNDLRSEETQAAEIVNAWYASNPGYYAQQVLQSEMGTHLDQYMVFSRLTIEHQVDFYREAIGICREKSLSGFSAGSFMLGRFLSNRQPVAFWKALSPEEILFAINEWVLFEKYMQVLNEVGERRISRARDKILSTGLGSLRLQPAEMKIFVTVKLAGHDLRRIVEPAPAAVEPETPAVLQFIAQPYQSMYAGDVPWERDELRKICEENGLPPPDDQSGLTL